MKRPNGLLGHLIALLDRIPIWASITVTLGVVVIMLGSVVHVSYFSLAPGGGIDMLDRIKIRGVETSESKGQLLLTTAAVSRRELTVWEWVGTMLDEDVRAIPSDLLRPSGQSNQESTAENFADMERSKISAEVAAFAAIGRPAARLPGVSVLSVVAGAPASGRVKPGDRLIGVDGRLYPDPTALVAALKARKPGHKASITLIRGKKERTITIGTRPSRLDASIPVIGVNLGAAYVLPNDVVIDSLDVGGPSGGLVFALALIDKFDAQDLTRGYVIAATGEIDAFGRVFPVGAVEEKAKGIEASGATIFMVPKSEVARARRAAGPSITILGVDTVAEAVAKLRALPRR